MGASVIYPNEIYTAFAFVGFLCSVIPLPWHLQAWNTGTCIFMFWCALSTMNMFVNSIVWHHSVINYAPVWCDISSRIIIGVNVGIPAAMLCVNRRLYHIASIKTVTISRAEKRRGVLIDLAIGLGIPIIDIILAYIPQGHRFNIFEDVGCWTAIYVTPVAMVLVFSVPFFISFVSAIYAALAVRAFWKQRAQFDKIVASHSNCTKNRYLRLMALGLWEVLVNLPLTLYVIVANARFVSPWLGWADTHLDFGRIEQVPHVLWAAQGAELELTRWLFVLCPYVFFFFFGFAEEARKHYRSAYQTVTKATGLSSIGSWGNSGTFFGSSKGSTTEVNSSGGTLPVYVKRDIHRKRDTLDSISDMTTSICDDASINEKAHDEKFDVPDYDNIVLPIAGGVIGDLKADEATPSPSSSNSSRVSLPRFLVSPPHNARPDSGIIEISSIREDAPVKVSDKESRV